MAPAGGGPPAWSSFHSRRKDEYDKLKRALRAEVDEAAWTPLYSTRSRAFPRPVSVITISDGPAFKITEGRITGPPPFPVVGPAWPQRNVA
jgi:hypothetical protein